jgi:hypothetical protein
LFEERGWLETVYRRTWANPGATGLFITRMPKEREFAILAGEPDSAAGEFWRVTAFVGGRRAAIAAMDFCEGIWPLGDWKKPSGWVSDAKAEQMNEIAVEVSRGKDTATI